MSQPEGEAGKNPSASEGILNSLVAGTVFAWHWPWLPAAGFIFGALAGVKLMKAGPRGLSISLVYTSLCLLYHVKAHPGWYHFLYSLNPAYFRTAIFLLLPAAVLWRINRMEWFTVFLCMILMSTLFATDSEGVTALLIMMFFLAAAFKSGELNRLCIVPLAMAIFHCVLLTGFYSYNGTLPQIRGKMTSAELRKSGFPGDTFPLILPHLKTEKGARAAGTYPGRSNPVKALFDNSSNDLYLQTARSGGSGIFVLDPLAFSEKRKSFPKACGGGADADFDISPDGRFISCIKDETVVLIDSGSLEWLDTLKVNYPLDRARTRFGPPGALYVSSMTAGVVLELKHDEYGHGLRLTRVLKASPGVLPLAFLRQDHFLVAGNNLTGKIFIINPETFTVFEEKEILPNLKMDEHYTDEKKILFRTEMNGKNTWLRAGIIEILNWKPEKGWRRKRGPAVYFLMPVKLLRSTL